MDATQRNAEIESEKKQLAKAEKDIEEGWTRLQNQRDLVLHLHAHGQDAGQAERLVDVLGQTLFEWERHRGLIEQRIAYLEGL